MKHFCVYPQFSLSKFSGYSAVFTKPGIGEKGKISVQTMVFILQQATIKIIES